MSVNAEVERTVLGWLMASPPSIDVADSEGLRPGDFEDYGFQIVAADIFEARADRRDTGSLAVASRVAHKLASAWGSTDSEVPAYLSAMLPERGGTYPALTELIEKVKLEGLRRRTLAEIDRLEVELRDPDKDPREVAASVQSLTVGERVKEGADVAEALRIGYNEAVSARAARGVGGNGAVTTGLRCFDLPTHGMRPGEIAFLGGDPGGAKTSLGLRMQLGFATTAQKDVPAGEKVGSLFLSLEMSQESAAARLTSMVTKVHASRFRDGAVTDGDLAAITMHRDQLRDQDVPMWIHAETGANLSLIRSTVASHVRRHNTGFVVLDHFQEFSLDRRLKSDLQEDAEKVMGLRRIAKEMNVAMVVIAHTTKRSGDFGGPKLPTMGDLRGSKMISAVADFVFFTYHPAAAKLENGEMLSEQEKCDRKLVVAKSRFGERGTYDFTFDATSMAIHSF